ncbi:MAG: DUF1801 domain-containing protein [Caulobacterales bacterium]|jgi:hypothetical protein
MAKEAKTKPRDVDVDAFVAAAEPAQRADDGKVLLQIMRDVSGLEPQMWGPSIVGFGAYTYRYESGHTGTMCRIGFSPRKANLVVYLVDGYEHRADELAKLGKHKIGKSCLYLTSLKSVDLDVLKALIAASWEELAQRYP